MQPLILSYFPSSTDTTLVLQMDTSGCGVTFLKMLDWLNPFSFFFPLTSQILDPPRWALPVHADGLRPRRRALQLPAQPRALQQRHGDVLYLWDRVRDRVPPLQRNRLPRSEAGEHPVRQRRTHPLDRFWLCQEAFWQVLSIAEINADREHLNTEDLVVLW